MSGNRSHFFFVNRAGTDKRSRFHKGAKKSPDSPVPEPSSYHSRNSFIKGNPHPPLPLLLPYGWHYWGCSHCPGTGSRSFPDRHNPRIHSHPRPRSTAHPPPVRFPGKARHHVHTPRCSGLDRHGPLPVMDNPRQYPALPHHPPPHDQAPGVQRLCYKRIHPARLHGLALRSDATSPGGRYRPAGVTSAGTGGSPDRNGIAGYPAGGHRQPVIPIQKVYRLLHQISSFIAERKAP